ncbi:MAG: dienelactone hydrolase family protein [Burkholderiaceae bacterium]|nr:dienelactone hydrolase family protein [Burkholderiaceae bacterium]
MSGQWISINGEFGGYLALPPRGRGPGLVLFQEIFGVNGHIRAVAEQYALDGFVVLAPDLFWRQAPRVELGYEGADRERAMALMRAARPEELLADVQQAVAALRARSEVTDKVGAFGYCMGGRLAYLAAATTDIAAASCFYGGGIQDHLQYAPNVCCPIQFHYGEQDAMIPRAAVEKVQAAFAGRLAEVFLYPAGHGFNCWERASYDPPSAALAHARTLALFAQQLF